MTATSEHIIRRVFSESIRIRETILNSDELIGSLKAVADALATAFQNGQKALFCGNGGSAGDAQHLAAEFSGRFYFDRPPLFAEALHVNTSYLTAVANDYGYDHVYERAVEAMGSAGDFLFGISTSGNSGNVVKALEKARMLGMTTVAFTGKEGGGMQPLADFWLPVPSNDTPRIQECHIQMGHIICQLVEATLFQNQGDE